MRRTVTKRALSLVITLALILCFNAVAFAAESRTGGIINSGSYANLITVELERVKFYSYDPATKLNTEIQTGYKIDKNGYVHFETPLVGDIIITDKPLIKK